MSQLVHMNLQLKQKPLTRPLCLQSNALRKAAKDKEQVLMKYDKEKRINERKKLGVSWLAMVVHVRCTCTSV